MSADFPLALLRLALAASAGIVLMLLLRRQLRARFGAGAAYLAWAIVPAMLAVAALPPLRIVEPKVVAVLAGLPGGGAGHALALPPEAIWPQLLLCVWVAGAALMAALLVREQLRFVRALGRLRPRGGAYVAESRHEGPVLLGLWQPKLVLPADFDARYTPDEQALIVAHENTHAVRRDPEVNALLACLQVCFWFNPLVHYAAPRFRLDQELACDATVMDQHPGTARAYARAMLKTQMADTSTSAACHWQSNHPLKERFMNLQQTSLNPVRRRAGRLAIAALVLAGIGATLAARADSGPASQAPLYTVKMAMTVNGHTSHPMLRVREGEKFKVTQGSSTNNSSWSLDMVLKAEGNKQVRITSKVAVDGKLLGEPAIQMPFNENAAMRFSSEDGKSKLEIEMVVSPWPEKGA